MLRDGVRALCDQHGLVPEDDAELFDEIVDLCEWPEPIIGSIPEDALVLPEAIIITPMKVHQRYIPLRDENGGLSKHFIAVANGKHDAEGLDLIRVGNERVLNARLRDAKYFWDTDTKQPLGKFAEGLARVTFHQKLGSVADKLERLRRLYAALKDRLPSVEDEKIQQTFTLMKADLTTQMVFEFDSLEGVVGKLYAEKEGIDQDVANAILEHRFPRRADDKLPSGALGIVAGVLDRLDTLAGYFGIGVRVKGTSDPFGLRRNALALLSIASSTGLDLDLEGSFKAALGVYDHMLHDGDKALRDILDFFKDRQEVMARDEGYPYDQVTAGLACHAEQPLQLSRCLEALKGIDEKTMQDVAEQAKRIQRIAVDPAPDFDHKLLEDNEKALYGIACDGAERLRVLVEQKDWASALREIVSWVPTIDKYFVDILVNHEDDGIRRNRHAMLQSVLDAMATVADFTAIEKREVE
jgi:glycyl-tRNA synthetase beta chain